MRRIRGGLLLLAMLGVLAVVGNQYRRAKASETQHQVTPPTPLRAGIDASSTDWIYRKENGACPQLELRAREMESAGEPASKLLLKKVQLRLFHQCGAQYDFIRSESAEFDKTEGRMFSDGEVQITLAVKNTIAGTVAGMLSEEIDQPGRLLTIKATGVTVDVESGKARTDQKTTFEFDLGHGDAVGAAYDPNTRELELLADVHLLWKGRDPKGKPMNLEAGKLLYKETESKVFLSPWAKLKRDGLTLESENADIVLDQGAIRVVNALKAHGTDKYPNRELNFGANELVMNLSEKSAIEAIAGTGQARLDTVSATAHTKVATDRIDLAFEASEQGSLLRTATATGHAVVESKPTAPNQSTRVLKAEHIVTRMRAGGEEIEAMETHSAGTLELIPNGPGQPRRHLEAERMWIAYGEKNRLQSFRAVQAATETRKPRGLKQKVDPPPAYTWSRDLTAEFHPVSGELTKLDQWNDFRYKEGQRESKADHATLDAPSNLITLTRSAGEAARAWDPTGSVAADKIVMNQSTGDFTAEGKVASTRLPDKKPGAAAASAKPNAMLQQDEAMRATADRMTSTDDNRRVVYEGKVTLWQTANRLQAQHVVIDRTARKLNAEGSVVSQFLDKKPHPRTGRIVNTVVRAGKLEYDDAARLAHYSGGSRMVRDDMDVKSRELRAWLADDGKGDSSLDHAFADGAVEIFQSQPERTRRGTAEHAEYYVAGEKLILNGGVAQMVDSKDGTTKGAQLTYFAGNDTLQVEGAIAEPAVSRIRRK